MYGSLLSRDVIGVSAPCGLHADAEQPVADERAGRRRAAAERRRHVAEDPLRERRGTIQPTSGRNVLAGTRPRDAGGRQRLLDQRLDAL